MEAPTVAALIASGAALLAAFVSGAVAINVARSGRKERERGSLQAPPSSGRAAARVEQGLARLPTLDWWLGRAVRHTTARPVLKAVDAVQAAEAPLMLVAPREVIAAMEQINEVLREVSTRDERWLERWYEARGELLRVSRAQTGAAALR